MMICCFSIKLIIDQLFGREGKSQDRIGRIEGNYLLGRQFVLDQDNGNMAGELIDLQGIADGQRAILGQITLDDDNIRYGRKSHGQTLVRVCCALKPVSEKLRHKASTLCPASISIALLSSIK